VARPVPLSSGDRLPGGQRLQLAPTVVRTNAADLPFVQLPLEPGQALTAMILPPTQRLFPAIEHSAGPHAGLGDRNPFDAGGLRIWRNAQYASPWPPASTMPF
jgi:hypothetical protein